MPRRWIRKFLPEAEKLRKSRVFAWLGPWASDPRVWRLNRRSAAGAVAVGLACGLIPGPLQMLGACLVCVGLRVNLPLAVVTTFYTNPLTIVPLYVLAFHLGALVVPGGSPLPPVELPHALGLADYLPALWAWMKALGAPLAAGIPLLAFTLAALGWLAVDLGWRAWTISAWRRRALRR